MGSYIAFPQNGQTYQTPTFYCDDLLRDRRLNLTTTVAWRTGILCPAYPVPHNIGCYEGSNLFCTRCCSTIRGLFVLLLLLVKEGHVQIQRTLCGGCYRIYFTNVSSHLTGVYLFPDPLLFIGAFLPTSFQKYGRVFPPIFSFFASSRLQFRH